MCTLKTASAGETIALGRRLGAALGQGDVVALVGDLGSGKTWFTKGLALGLGVPGDTVVTSPSFSLVNEYEGRCTLYHMDAYRLETVADFIAAGLEEYFFKEGVVAVEWADRWPEILPEWSVKVEMRIEGETTRIVTLAGYHPRSVELVERIAQDYR